MFVHKRLDLFPSTMGITVFALWPFNYFNDHIVWDYHYKTKDSFFLFQENLEY